METRLFRILVTLGVPGVALGAFYLLLKGFGFRFDTIGGTWSAIIALVFLLIVGTVTIYALNRWAPRRKDQEPEPQERQDLKVGSSVVIARVPQRSLESEEGIVRWKPDMDKYCGREAVITEINRNGAPAAKLNVDSGANWWALEWLNRRSAARSTH